MANSAQSGGPKLSVIFLKRRILISAVLLICVVALITSNTFWRWMYPIGYQSDIQQAARTIHVDPLLVASIIRVESKFQREDVSHAGAIGLMQLMPDTALWIANQDDISGLKITGWQIGHDNNSLAIPSVNIHLGSWYVHHLIEVFDGNQVAAVAAYNAGPQRVQDWLKTGQWDGKLATIDHIPVGETRHFVGRVFYNYDLYKRIYGEDRAWQNGKK